ncbi:CHRD domain-containing protein [Hymenobacter psychrophilus]|uniref:CHRD domain-containing protein n=1 Tax=Hymenobacter psychrophilus TaxID=651662 RepID=A0A1H3NR63_9BACT|nr:CHRD domain-containing protein [Hymenobacter psychrophilus]SDY90935.1 CHRD domain-containing protein [Hymenobacter psychrophilus]
MNKLTSLFFALGVVALGACNNDDDDNVTPANTMMTVSATLDNKQAVPTTVSTATGMMTGTFDKTTKVLQYNVTYQGLSPTMGHLHFGKPGKKGNIAVGFNDVSKSPITGTVTLQPSTADSLMAGQIYVNLHSTAYPGGEIRGNVTAK